jgi:hypothetical protein
LTADALARRTHRIELAATVLLAFAAVATAWSSYQSARWRGTQALKASKATAARIASSQAATRAGQLTQIDVATFIQWVDADVTGNRKLAEFYRHRFRKEFRPAFAAWLATTPRTNPNAPLTPFALPQYRLAETQRSGQLDALGALAAAGAEKANQKANDYVLAVVLFASCLFFAGISTKVHALGQREALLVIGWTIWLGTAIWLATLAF